MATVLEKTRDLSYGLHWQLEQVEKEHDDAKRAMQKARRDISGYDAMIDILATCFPVDEEDYYTRDAFHAGVVAKAKGKRARAYEAIDRLDKVMCDSVKKMRKLDVEIAVADARVNALRRVLM